MRLRLRNPLPPLPPLEEPAWQEYTLLGLTLLAVFFACYQPLWDPDSFWHLAVGRQIWQTHHLVRTETFSFTAYGTPWADTEWLFHILGYGLWKLLGYRGLAYFTGFMGALGAFLMYRVFRVGGGSASTFTLYALILLPVYLTRVRFRPDLFSVLFFAALMEGLLRWKPAPPRVGHFWIFLAVLFCLWAQFHGGWAYGIALLGAYLVGEVLDAVRERTLTLRYFVMLSLTGGAAVAALFLNPYGWKVPWFPVKSLVGFSNTALVQIVEWDHTPFRWPYLLLMAVALLLIGLLFASWRRLTWKETFWASLQVFLSLYWVRYVAYGVVGLTPFGARAAEKLTGHPLRRRIICAVSLVIAMGSCAYFYVNHSRELNLTERYPVLETRFLRRYKVSGNLLNTYAAGGYLDWYAPLDRVLMDGRYYPFANVLKDYWSSHKTVAQYKSFLSRYPFDIALYPYPDFKLRGMHPLPGSPLRGPSAIFFPEKKWALVYSGSYGMVLLKREARYASLIAKKGYRLLRPDDLQYLLWEARSGKINPRELRKEIDRAIREAPYSSGRTALEKAASQLESGNAGT